jgi:hypothetical protein
MMTKTQAISLLLQASIQAHGGDVQKGFDAIMGEGAYLKLAGEVWTALRAKA